MIEWRDIPGFEDDYQVSSDGQIRSKDRIRKYYNSRFNKTCSMHLKGKLRAQTDSHDGYKEVHLQRSDTNQSYYARTHRLVAMAFIPNPQNKPQVNHIDGNKQNNCVDNLEWVTAAENTQHAMKYLHGVWMRNNKSSCIRVKCLDENLWFDSMLEAGEWAGGDSSRLIVALNANKPYKGHVFLRENELAALDVAESDYVQKLMENYSGSGKSFSYIIHGSNGEIFTSQAKFVKAYQLSADYVSKVFKLHNEFKINGITFTRQVKERKRYDS